MSVQPRGLAILSIGTALPPHAMNQEQAAELARRIAGNDPQRAALLKVLYRRAGVQTRYTVVPYQRALQWLPADDEHDQASVPGPTTAERMAVYREHAPLLAARAAEEALRRAALDPGQVSHLITVSCTGFHAPGIDLELTQRLGLPSTVERTHVGYMGCHGAINGLRVAQAFSQAESSAKVLLCAVELCSLHYQYAWNPEHLVGNAVFGDGAAALVGAGASTTPAWRVAATGSCLLPDSREAMSWSISDHGFVMQLSARVPDLIQEHLRGWLESWLAGLGLRLSEIGSWAVHPGGPRIVSAVERALELTEGATSVSREVLQQCGNLSSPTLLFILERLMRQGAPRPCVLLGFGPGLAAEAALLI